MTNFRRAVACLLAAAALAVGVSLPAHATNYVRANYARINGI